METGDLTLSLMELAAPARFNSVRETVQLHQRCVRLIQDAGTEAGLAIELSRMFLRNDYEHSVSHRLAVFQAVVTELRNAQQRAEVTPPPARIGWPRPIDEPW